MPYYLNATPEQLRHLFRSRKGGQAYTAPERRLSLYLDVDAGQSKSLSSYSDLWREPRSSLQRGWGDVTRDVWMQATSDERQWTNQAERYVELAGMDYDESIPARCRTALQSKETFRPDADVVERLRGGLHCGSGQAQSNPDESRADRGQKWADRGQKTASDDAENAGFGQVVGRSGQMPGRHTNTSSSSGSSLSLPPSPREGFGADAQAEEASLPPTGPPTGPADRLADGPPAVFDPVAVFEAVFPGQRLTIQQGEQIRLRVRDPDLYRQTLERWSLNYPHLPHQVGSQLERYEQDERRTERAEEPVSGPAAPPGGGDGGGLPPRRRRGQPAEQHTFEGARRTADRAIERYDRLFGGGAEGGGEGGD